MAWQRRGREDATGSRDAIVLIKVAKVVVTTKCTQIGPGLLNEILINLNEN